MIKFCVLLLIVCCQNIIGDDVTDGTKLVMSFLIHRHSDRTPVAATIMYSNNPEKLKELSAPYGYGQLTKAGKQRSYALGEYIRSRYAELLAPKYNSSEVYIRSTDSTRAKMTILTALAAIYPPHGDGWSNDLDWEPVPYTTVPAKYDFNLAVVNCPKFMTINKRSFAYSPSGSSVSRKHSKIIKALSKQIGMDLRFLPALIYPIYDVCVSQRSLGLPIDQEIEDNFHELEAAAGDSIALTFGQENTIAMQAGVLLNEFLQYSALAISGQDTQRFRIYSAHDVNVYAFEAATKVPRQGVPKYASAYALEVRKVVNTGQFVVLPVYLPQPGQEVVYLKAEGCDDLLCDYEQFVNATQKYAMDVETWRTKCGFTNDLEIDDSSIN